STFPLASAVSSGQVSVAYGIYHAALPVLEKDAPVKAVFPETIPYSGIYTGVVNVTENPKSAKLLVAWLNTDEGAQVLDEETGRSNPYLDTPSASKLEGHTLSTYPVSETEEYSDL